MLFCAPVNGPFRLSGKTLFCITQKLAGCYKRHFSFCLVLNNCLHSNQKLSDIRNDVTCAIFRNLTFTSAINIRASHNLIVIVRPSTNDVKPRLPHVFVRHKSGKRKKVKGDSAQDDLELDDHSGDEDEGSSDQEEEEDDDFGAPKDYKDVTITVASLRADAVLKAGLGISRTKIEDQFYNGKLYLNGQKILKKSTQVAIGDEVDLVMAVHEDNEHMLDVQRVIVKSVKEEKTKRGNSTLKVRRWKNLTVENYL